MKAEDKFELYRPKKFLGQNFLVDDNIARKIVQALAIAHDDTVVEIGPGRGALTKHIAGKPRSFTAVEYDKAVCEDLRKQYEGIAEIVHDDFLDYELRAGNSPSGSKLKVIGNIPYNITSKILFKLFDSRELIASAVLMMQKEVAMRIAASPRSKNYGILSVQSQAYCTPKILFHVPPTAFFPKPTVTSSIISLDFSGSPLISGSGDPALFKLVVRESFGKRRKVLSNSLANVFRLCGISPDELEFDLTRRPETLTPEEFILLSDMIGSLKRSV
ncbi:MAG: 16S rRNA (adenine(1518)-N(6)/adenine(1519)-N(6))-dimethyltransferase RsmA [Ignavibacteria bacterium]|nr:16S rRNA (adenine(1518)-N(6)/adenine(1519)-N(6))-dimethyltransferase RsmA [Ignavibacteria bacterium]